MYHPSPGPAPALVVEEERRSFINTNTSKSTFKLSVGRQSQTKSKLFVLAIGTLAMVVAVPLLNLHSMPTTLNLQTSSTQDQEENDGNLKHIMIMNNVDVVLATSKNESNNFKPTMTSTNQKASKLKSVVNEAWCASAVCSNSALCQPCTMPTEVLVHNLYRTSGIHHTP